MEEFCRAGHYVYYSILAHWHRKLLKVRGATYTTKLKGFSIAKLNSYRVLKFKRGHGPPGPPTSAAYVESDFYCQQY